MSYPVGHRGTPEERFWAKVDKSGGCWLWTAAIRYGYGAFRVDGKTVQAHRWIYEQTVGPVPRQLVLDHLCRVRACVRSDHLEPVTDRENLLRGIGPAATNAAKTHCIHGHEFTAESTRVKKDGTRDCRVCARNRAVRNWAQRREMVG